MCRRKGGRKGRKAIKMMNESITLEQLDSRIREVAGAFDCCYLHWTAGHYGQHDAAYHLNIDKDGSLWQTLPFTHTPAATWHRNYRSIAIALDGCADAALYADGTVDFGTEPPTDAQIEALAQVIATISNASALPIRKSLFMTHAEAAELDDYGPNTSCERWDLWVLPGSEEWGSGGDYIRGKALFYQNEWKKG